LETQTTIDANVKDHSAARSEMRLPMEANTQAYQSFECLADGSAVKWIWFRAEFTSRSCVTPHALHTQTLTTSMSKPVGPVRALQSLHVRVESLSLTMITLLLALVLQLRLEHAPTGIQHGFGHPSPCQFQAAHIADLYDLIIVYDFS
jgi:hypothetical protein